MLNPTEPTRGGCGVLVPLPPRLPPLSEVCILVARDPSLEVTVDLAMLNLELPLRKRAKAENKEVVVPTLLSDCIMLGVGADEAR